jgi:hypothetical protein
MQIRLNISQDVGLCIANLHTYFKQPYSLFIHEGLLEVEPFALGPFSFCS